MERHAVLDSLAVDLQEAAGLEPDTSAPIAPAGAGVLQKDLLGRVLKDQPVALRFGMPELYKQASVGQADPLARITGFAWADFPAARLDPIEHGERRLDALHRRDSDQAQRTERRALQSFPQLARFCLHHTCNGNPVIAFSVTYIKSFTRAQVCISVDEPNL